LRIDALLPESDPPCPLLTVGIVGKALITAPLAGQADTVIEKHLSADARRPLLVTLSESNSLGAVSSSVMVAAGAEPVPILDGFSGIFHAALFVVGLGFELLLEVSKLQAGQFILNLAGFKGLSALFEFEGLQLLVNVWFFSSLFWHFLSIV
jgi:hypothetical protein